MRNTNYKKITSLINEFNDVHQRSDHADYMLSKKDISQEERDEYEDEADMYLCELSDVAGKIKQLKPSKYMMEKYLELDYIMTFA